MGLVIQFQRRAIESFRDEPEAVPLQLGEQPSLFADEEGVPLYYAGVSPGIGTCSDVLGMDVLVLSQLSTQRQLKIAKACAYTVLLRSPNKQELEADGLAAQGVSRQCVELLSPISSGPDQGIIFQRTGKSRSYTALV